MPGIDDGGFHRQGRCLRETGRVNAGGGRQGPVHLGLEGARCPYVAQPSPPRLSAELVPGDIRSSDAWKTHPSFPETPHLLLLASYGPCSTPPPAFPQRIP